MNPNYSVWMGKKIIYMKIISSEDPPPMLWTGLLFLMKVISAQQIMNRDGGLKLRIDDLDYVQGKSSDWVTALNFNTSLPAGLFPFPLPIRIFFDVGTYAEAWQNNPPTSKFLYTGGIQLSLFKNVLNIYAPLIYSSDFNTAFGTSALWKKNYF